MSSRPRDYVRILQGIIVGCVAAWSVSTLALDAPVLRVTGADVPMPYNKHLEKAAKPDAGKVVEAAKQVLYMAQG
jgi:pyruvate/2-oxoglutarate/acetoin dehydrogenase E1 component